MRSLVTTVLLAVLAITGYFGARYWQSSRAVEILNSGAACDLGQAACVHVLPDGGRLLVDVAPRPVPLMQTVHFVVTVRDSAVQPDYIELTGLNMEMGINRVSLKPGTDGSWRGETIIPICSQTRMHWRAALVLRSGGRLIGLDDEFHTSRP